MAFQALKEIYAKSMQREEMLSDLYDVAELGLRQPESREVVQALQREHKDKLKILERVNVADFGHAEWVKYPPEIDDDEMVPRREIKRDTPPAEILRLILGFEEKQAAFYRALHDGLSVSDEKDLFESLVVFKRNQADSVRRLMADFPTDA